jgi:RNA polymerase sigma-70 factor (ECF subfamily)
VEGVQPRPLPATGADPIESDLLAQARRGNAFAFEEIVRRHQQQVYRVALRIVRRHEVADDVAQEAFIRAYQSLDRFDLSRPFGPWIRRIAANLAVNHLRSPRAREDELQETAQGPTGGGSDPLGEAMAGEARDALDQALARLPAEQRAVFVLRAVEELTYAEIAEALGISEGTVMSRLFRAREKLRVALAAHLVPRGRREASLS